MKNLHTIYGESITDNDTHDIIYKKYRSQWHNNPKTFTVSDAPLFLDIEATSICNLRCPHCIQTRKKFEKGYMDLGLYTKIIDEASEIGVYGCKYHTIGRGEPLLHCDLSYMIAYAKKKGLIDVYLNTNGILLDKRKCYELLDAGLDRISFSIDGHDYQSYKKYRGGNINSVASAVSMFKFARDKGNYSTKIRIQTVALRHVNLIDYKKYWSKYCDEVCYLTEKDMHYRENDLKSDWICPQPWRQLSILFSGDVLPCNHDDRKLASLGNIKDISLHKVWHGKAMKYMRLIQKAKQSQLLSACNGCYLRTSCIENLK